MPIKQYSSQELFDGIIARDISLLSKAITLCESKLKKHQKITDELIKKCLPYSQNSIRIGITGVPGVGKSTFIEVFANRIIEKLNKPVCVLAVDPSSKKNKGAIMGDKTRMASLSSNDRAYIRPSASGESLGGVCNGTRETIILCEAFGFEYIIIETIGVGQLETQVKSMTDFLLLLMLSNAGDELQGIKRGIIEMADAIFINKADGDNIKKAKIAKQQYTNALQFMPSNLVFKNTPVEICSSITHLNIDKVIKTINNFKEESIQKGLFYSNRKNQLKNWMYDYIKEHLFNKFLNKENNKVLIGQLEEKVISNQINPRSAVNQIFKSFGL